MASRLVVVVLFALTSACAIDSADEECIDGKCDGAGACQDARYNDGTCNTDLSCVTPDIDCFVTFESDAKGKEWFAGLEAQFAMQEGREPRAFVAETDPRFIKFRENLDRGWEAFKASRPVGDLKKFRPALVMIVDPKVNAFVAPETLERKKSAFAVMVQTGALERNLSDEAVLGVVMHELQHAVGLHLIEEVKNDGKAQELASKWLDAASEVGVYSDAALGGYPVTGLMSSVLTSILSSANQSMPVASLLSPVAPMARIPPLADAALMPNRSSAPLFVALMYSGPPHDAPAAA
jgi:hypothetical protein